MRGDFYLSHTLRSCCGLATASLDVVFSYIDHNNGLEKAYLDKEVSFEKTAAGRRVSGGSFFETMMFRFWEVENPLTSDSPPVTIAILGTVAVISLALPVVIYKRRRRAA